MENLISKELLSKVLDNEVPYQIKVHRIIIKNNSLNYYYNSKDSRGGLFEANEYINIYELAHKCKEWAGSLGKYHCIYSGLYESTDQGTLCICLLDSNDFWANTEQEAIFKACQWILDNKESK